MIPLIKSVKANKDYSVTVTFKNNERKKLDIMPYIKKFTEFQILNNKLIFNNVQVIDNGLAVAWNDCIDIDRCDFYKLGTLL